MVQLSIKSPYLGSFISVATKRTTIIIVSYVAIVIEVVVSCLNCPIVEIKWVKSLPNHGTCDDTLFSRKSFALTISYNF